MKTSRESIRAFCNKYLQTHTDWTGTRVETKNNCGSIDEFADKLVEWFEENSEENWSTLIKKAFIETASQYLEGDFKQLAGYYAGAEYVDAFRKAMEEEL